MCGWFTSQVQVPMVPTCVGAAAQPLAAKGIQREPDCSEVQSLGNSDRVKSMSARNNVHWEQGGGLVRS